MLFRNSMTDNSNQKPNENSNAKLGCWFAVVIAIGIIIAGINGKIDSLFRDFGLIAFFIGIPLLYCYFKLNK